MLWLNHDHVTRAHTECALAADAFQGHSCFPGKGGHGCSNLKVHFQRAVVWPGWSASQVQDKIHAAPFLQKRTRQVRASWAKKQLTGVT